jgi:hypothetical protein
VGANIILSTQIPAFFSRKVDHGINYSSSRRYSIKFLRKLNLIIINALGTQSVSSATELFDPFVSNKINLPQLLISGTGASHDHLALQTNLPTPLRSHHHSPRHWPSSRPRTPAEELELSLANPSDVFSSLVYRCVDDNLFAFQLHAQKINLEQIQLAISRAFDAPEEICTNFPVYLHSLTMRRCISLVAASWLKHEGSF